MATVSLYSYFGQRCDFRAKGLAIYLAQPEGLGIGVVELLNLWRAEGPAVTQS